MSATLSTAGSGIETNGTSRVETFARELHRDLLLWLISFLILAAFRLLMIWLFGSQMRATSGGEEILKALLRGARFDSMAASYPVALCLPFTAFCLLRDVSRLGQRVRIVVGILAVGVHLAICGITVGYFREYHDQFNQWIIGLITDDLGAITRTIWRGYPILAYLTGYLLVLAFSGWGIARLLRWFPPPRLKLRLRSGAAAGLTLALVVGLFFLGIRGWGIRRPVKQRDLAATSDPFLNKLVANPYVALRYAILDYKYVTSAQGLSTFLGGGSIVDAAKTAFPNSQSWADLDQLCRRSAKGHPGTKPRHIFLIVCESLDAWPMLPEFRSLGLADGLLTLATNGISCKAFISSGFETIQSIGTLISGLPEAGININYQPSSRTPFPTASAPVFKRLGYHTKFIYGGFSWQRADEFALAQGFDDFEGVPSFKNLPAGAVGTWGAFDEFVFDHILRSTPPDTPTFDLVLTTVNHPPYDCDVFAHGFPHRTMPAPYDRIYDGTDPMKVFGHQWYTAKCVADFVATASQRLPGSVFVVTGDHASRHFLNSHPSVFESMAVPCIIYGPEVLAGVEVPAKMAGSHLDLIATLAELSADRGFEYSAFGRNLFDGSQKPVGLGCRAVVTPEFFFRLREAERPEVIPGEVLPVPMPDLEELKRHYLSVHALSWWRVMKGSRLPER
ncbi:MAG TPA: sulfatase-like hydrolase/transferase [Verrucomicrobiae bacterium]